MSESQVRTISDVEQIQALGEELRAITAHYKRVISETAFDMNWALGEAVAGFMDTTAVMHQPPTLKELHQVLTDQEYIRWSYQHIWSCMAVYRHYDGVRPEELSWTAARSAYELSNKDNNGEIGDQSTAVDRPVPTLQEKEAFPEKILEQPITTEQLEGPPIQQSIGESRKEQNTQVREVPPLPDRGQVERIKRHCLDKVNEIWKRDDYWHIMELLNQGRE